MFAAPRVKTVTAFNTVSNGRSFCDRLLHSLEYLGFKARSHNAAAACDTVSRVLAEQQKYALYREMFPDEWKVSRASLYRAGTYRRYSERVNELFELVNNKCFPLLEYWHDDPEQEFEQFAIMPLNFDLCCEEIDFESLRISYVAGLLFYFRDDEILGFFEEKFGLSTNELPEIAKSPHPKVWSKKQSPKTRAYSKLLKLVDHSTGNPWLDITNCQYPELFEWDAKTIKLLTETYRAAADEFKNLEKLDERLERDALQFISELIRFWNTGSIAVA
ncbi:MAG: hypothetical protein ACRD6X_15695 [Pyrinomonadaceae bacterium]